LRFVHQPSAISEIAQEIKAKRHHRFFHLFTTGKPSYRRLSLSAQLNMPKKKSKKKSKNITTSKSPSLEATPIAGAVADDVDPHKAGDDVTSTNKEVTVDTTVPTNVNADSSVESTAAAAVTEDTKFPSNLDKGNDGIDDASSFDFVEDVDMGSGFAASRDAMVIEKNDELTKDIKHELEEAGEVNQVLDNQNDAGTFNAALNEETTMTTPLLNQDISHQIEGTSLKKPVEGSYEDTVALISTIEEGVKKGQPLNSDDPWSSFDSTNDNKSKSVIVVEEYEPKRKLFCNNLWNWLLERSCWKKKTKTTK
jgi:hypothetical protein